MINIIALISLALLLGAYEGKNPGSLPKDVSVALQAVIFTVSLAFGGAGFFQAIGVLGVYFCAFHFALNLSSGEWPFQVLELKWRDVISAKILPASGPVWDLYLKVFVNNFVGSGFAISSLLMLFT